MTRNFCFRFRFFKHGSLKYYFFLFFVILLVPISILGTAFYIRVYNQVNNDLNEQYNRNLSEVASSFDRKIEGINTLAVQLSNISWVQEIAYMQGNIDPKRITVKDINLFYEQLKLQQVLDPITSCYSLFFVNNDYVISSFGVSDGMTFYNEIMKSEFNYEMLLHSLSFQTQPTYFVSNNLSINTTIRDGAQVGKTIILYTPINQIPGHQVVLVSYIPIANIENLIRHHIDINQFPVIFSDLENRFQLTLSSEANVESSNYIYMKSNHFDWGFSSYVYPSTLQETNHNLFMLFFIFIFLIIFIISLISYLLATRHIKPIANLCSMLDSRNKDISIKNVNYESLLNSINELIDDDKAIQSQYDNLLPLARNFILSRLINGLPEMNTFSALYQMQNEMFPYSCFTVCIYLNDKRINRNMLTQVIERNNADINIYSIEEDALITMIVNHSQKHDVTELFKNIDFVIEDSLSTYGSLYVGNTYNVIDGVEKSYKEAKELIDYRYQTNDSQLYFYSNMKKTQSFYYYPISDELKLISAVQSGDSKLIYEIINEIFSVNIQQTNLSIYQLRYLAYALLNTADRCYSSNPQSSIRSSTEYKTIDDMSTDKELFKIVMNVFEEAVQFFQECSTQYDSWLKQKISDYMNRNICSPNISLSVLSTHIGYPEYYTSRFFKNAFGVNFLEYLHTNRLEIAKEMIEKGSSIKSIAVQTGYSSDITLRRTFKKYLGITPKEYLNAVKTPL